MVNGVGRRNDVYNDLYFALGLLVSLLYIMAIVVIIVIIRDQNKTVSPIKIDSKAPLPFSKLCDNVKQLSGLLLEAGANLGKLHLDLEDYGAKSWNQEKELEEKYLRTVYSLFLLLDHLENSAKDEKKSDEIGWIYRRTLRILEDGGIEEIPVKTGDYFSDTHHKSVKSRPDELPPSTVLEITRKGYHTKSKTGEDIILRPAEVIVSSGVSGKQPIQ